MPNLKIFGAKVHDCAFIFIVSSVLFSLGFSFFTEEIGRLEANLILLFSAITTFFYWYKEYKN